MNLVSSPKVSVVIPMYNACAYIGVTLENVLSQSFDNFEILVVNDGSTDSSMHVVSAFRDPRITLIDQKNGGVSAARNAAIMRAKGEYVAFLDADDLWHIDKLMHQVNALDNSSEIDFCYTDRAIFSDDDDINVHVNMSGIEVIQESLFLSLIKHNHIHCSSVMIRRKLFSNIGLFDTMLAASEDSDLWIKAANINRFIRLNSDLSFYRHHEMNTINSINFRRNRVHAELILLARWFKNNKARSIIADNIKGNSHALAYEEQEIGNTKYARRYFIMAFVLGKYSPKLLVKILLLYFKNR